jgi:DNA-binding transcriptional LysR family regulator
MLAVQLLGAASEETINRLIEGRLDMALGYFHRDRLNSDVDYDVIGSEALCIVARRHHPLGHELRLSVRALERAAWILHPHTSSPTQVLERIFLCAGMNPPANVVESNSLTMTLNLVLKSDAVTILPECAVRHHPQAGRLIRLPGVVDQHSIEFGILTRRGEPPCPAAAEFRELLRESGARCGGNGAV